METIKSLPNTPLFDLIFVDADKANYSNYWQECLPRLRKTGLLVIDNVLWSGRVLDPQDKSDHAIVALNELAKNDQQAQVLMLPIRDGMLLARKIT